MIGSKNWKQVLVFTRTKHGANRLTKQLETDGLSAAAIHGNKSQAARTRALADFKAEKIRVLVATDIAARGLDIAKLPHVVNFELPNVPEDYVHRIGRTGRASNHGLAISLVCADEHKLLKDIEKLLCYKIPQEIITGYEPSPDIKAKPPQKRSPKNRIICHLLREPQEKNKRVMVSHRLSENQSKAVENHNQAYLNKYYLRLYIKYTGSGAEAEEEAPPLNPDSIPRLVLFIPASWFLANLFALRCLQSIIPAIAITDATIKNPTGVAISPPAPIAIAALVKAPCIALIHTSLCAVAFMAIQIRGKAPIPNTIALLVDPVMPLKSFDSMELKNELFPILDPLVNLSRRLFMI